MLWVGTDYHNSSSSTNKSTLLTDFANRGTDFHIYNHGSNESYDGLNNLSFLVLSFIINKYYKEFEK